MVIQHIDMVILDFDMEYGLALMMWGIKYIDMFILHINMGYLVTLHNDGSYTQAEEEEESQRRSSATHHCPPASRFCRSFLMSARGTTKAISAGSERLPLVQTRYYSPRHRMPLHSGSAWWAHNLNRKRPRRSYKTST